MAHIVSVVLHSLALLDSTLGGTELHGAHLAITRELRSLINNHRIKAVEVFLEPREMANVPALEQAAMACLKPENRGQGRLRFYPITAFPDVMDEEPRILFCLDLDNLLRDKYLRDRFARGPMPIVCDTHSLGQYNTFFILNWLKYEAPAAGDTIAALSPALKQALVKVFEPEEPFQLVEWHRGIDVDRFHPVEDKRLPRERLRLPLDGTCFMYFGRLTPNSKADLLPLIEAFHEATNSDCYLLIVGIENTPGYGAILQRFAENLGARVFVRSQAIPPEESVYYYQSADVFCFPGDTVQEAFGTTYLEAMACGLPIITSDWVAGPTIVQHDVTGQVVPCYWSHPLRQIEALSPALDFMTNYLMLAQSVWVDTASLKKAIGLYANNAEIRLKHGAASRERAVANYDLEARMEVRVDSFDDAMTAAQGERPERRQERVDRSVSFGQPIPFRHVFSHYATGTLCDEAKVRLTEFGQRVARNGERVSFYEETKPLIIWELMQALLERCKNSPYSLGKLVREVVDATEWQEDSVRFHVGLLLKRSVLTASPKS